MTKIHALAESINERQALDIAVAKELGFRVETGRSYTLATFPYGLSGAVHREEVYDEIWHLRKPGHDTAEPILRLPSRIRDEEDAWDRAWSFYKIPRPTTDPGDAMKLLVECQRRFDHFEVLSVREGAAGNACCRASVGSIPSFALTVEGVSTDALCQSVTRAYLEACGVERRHERRRAATPEQEGRS